MFDGDGRVDPDKLEEWLLNHRIGIIHIQFTDNSKLNNEVFL